MRKRDVLRSPRLSELKKRRRKVFFSKVAVFLFGFLAILALLTYLSRIGKVNISEVETIGNKVVDSELIKEEVMHELAGHYFWIFPKSNIFFYPKNEVKEVLAGKFKRLKNITLNIKDNKILEISMEERIPKYTWCGETPSQAEENKTCYFTDESGYIFDEAPYFSGEVYFKFFGKPSVNVDNPSGSYFFGENFNKLLLFKNTLSRMGLKPASLYIENGGDIKIFLSKINSSHITPEIRLNSDADFEKVAENLQAALSTEPLQADFKKKYSSLLYIDLRFGNKVYYKFQ